MMALRPTLLCYLGKHARTVTDETIVRIRERSPEAGRLVRVFGVCEADLEHGSEPDRGLPQSPSGKFAAVETEFAARFDTMVAEATDLSRRTDLRRAGRAVDSEILLVVVAPLGSLLGREALLDLTRSLVTTIANRHERLLFRRHLVLLGPGLTEFDQPLRDDAYVNAYAVLRQVELMAERPDTVSWRQDQAFDGS
jgi:hypothetical protein